MVKTRKFHTEDRQILGSTIPNLVVKTTWCLGCAQPSAKLLLQRDLVGSPAATFAVLTDISCGFPRKRQASEGTKSW